VNDPSWRKRVFFLAQAAGAAHDARPF